MTKDKLAELRQRMTHHTVENDVAIVKLTAAELDELLTFAEKAYALSEKAELLLTLLP